MQLRYVVKSMFFVTSLTVNSVPTLSSTDRPAYRNIMQDFADYIRVSKIVDIYVISSKMSFRTNLSEKDIIKFGCHFHLNEDKFDKTDRFTDILDRNISRELSIDRKQLDFRLGIIAGKLAIFIDRKMADSHVEGIINGKRFLFSKKLYADVLKLINPNDFTLQSGREVNEMSRCSFQVDRL